MPVVVVTIMAKAEWYPRGQRARFTPSQELVWDLGNKMPSIIVGIWHEFKYTLDEKEVVVRFERIKDTTINAPDLWVLVQPMRSDVLVGIKRELNHRLTDDVFAFVSKRFHASPKVKIPQCDGEVIFLEGAGRSLDKRGRQVACW
jgi:hypothetical protein